MLGGKINALVVEIFRGPQIPDSDYWEIMKMKVIGIHENSPGQANAKNDSKNPFTQAQNKMKENNKDKNNGKVVVVVDGTRHHSFIDPWISPPTWIETARGIVYAA